MTGTTDATYRSVVRIERRLALFVRQCAHVNSNPVARLMDLQDQSAGIGALLIAMNEAFAVTKYGGQIVIASLFGSDISFMTVDDFHRMFAKAKFRDPIMVKNVLFIMVASNNEWAIPAGMGDRRWFVLDVADTYAGLGHQTYFTPLYAEIENGGAAAMLHDLLNMDLKAFDVRAIPHTAAKAKQQALSLNGPMAWLYDVPQEGSISSEQWQVGGLTMDTDRAYMCYVEFSKRQRDWKPEIKSVWSKNIRAALGLHINPTRPTKGNARVRSFQFAPLDDCRRQFASHLRAPDLAWETESQPHTQSREASEGMSDCEDTRLDALDTEWEPETDPEPESELEDGSSD